jgi:uncharacterized protein YecT (DUF1311 family)
MCAYLKYLLLAAVSLFFLNAYADEVQDDPVNEARDNCRDSSLEDDAKLVECLEKGIYDPCDEASGIHSHITARCVFGHTEVANRRVKKAEKEIIAQLKKSGNKTGSTEFRNSQRKWRDYVKSYCEFLNHADPDASPFGKVGFCTALHYENRANELEEYLAPPE